MVPVRCISSIRHMYKTDFAYDGPIFLVPLSPSYPSSPVPIYAYTLGKWHLNLQLKKNTLKIKHRFTKYLKESCGWVMIMISPSKPSPKWTSHINITKILGTFYILHAGKSKVQYMHLGLFSFLRKKCILVCIKMPWFLTAPFELRVDWYLLNLF